MGHLEDASKKRQRRADIEHMILSGLAASGIVAVGLIAPNVIGAMKKLGLMPRPRQREYINSARRKLKKSGLLIEENGFLRLSQRGARSLSVMSARMIESQPRTWDKKWRVLIFDIPERRRHIRDKIRGRLLAAGFVRAQDSVWIYPYPCEEFVALLKADCRVGKDMLYMIVDSLEGDVRFREEFGISMEGAYKPVHLRGIAGKALDVILPARSASTVKSHGRKR